MSDPRRWSERRSDGVVALAYAALSCVVTSGLWRDPDRRVVAFLGGADEMLLQWQLAHATHMVRHLGHPFFTTDMNSPAGINLAGNASILGLAVPLVPVTQIAGAGTSFALMATLAMSLTAFAWYLLMSRCIGLRRAAAFAGALACAFGPPLLSEGGGGHQHIAAQFLVPLIVWRVVRMATGKRPLRDGAVLGVVVAYQAFISEEILLFTAIAITTFLVAYGATQREARAYLRPLLRGGAVAAAVGLALLVIPLGYQFAGPAHYRGSPMDPSPFHADLMDYVRIPRWSRGYPILSLPIVAVVVAAAFWLRRNALYVATLVTLLVSMLLSFGGDFTVSGRSTGIPGPWRLAQDLPVLEWVIPQRLGHIAVAAAGVCIAIVVDRLLRQANLRARVALGVVAAALITVAPTPFETIALSPIPSFIRDGAWREHLAADRVLVTVPTPALTSFAAMRWATAARGDIPIAGGYFLGPSVDGKAAFFGAPPTWTTTMLAKVATTGEVYRPTDEDRQRFLTDLEWWRAGLLVLVPDEPNAAALEETVTSFIGPPTLATDVRVWHPP